MKPLPWVWIIFYSPVYRDAYRITTVNNMLANLIRLLAMSENKATQRLEM